MKDYHVYNSENGITIELESEILMQLYDVEADLKVTDWFKQI